MVPSRAMPSRPSSHGASRRARTWQVLPSGLIYPSDLASTKEPRLASQWFYDRHAGWTWDTELGARVGVLRYGTNDGDRPEGFQFDMEGAAFPRLSLEHGEDVVSTDYRVGFPFTYGWDRYQVKLGYIHICSHLGDEYMLVNPDVVADQLRPQRLPPGRLLLLHQGPAGLCRIVLGLRV